MWIGLSDTQREGTFAWEVDNSTVNFTKWEPGQPNNYGNYQYCVSLAVGTSDSFGLWNDESCDTPFYYICEKPLDGMCRPKFHKKN